MANDIKTLADDPVIAKRAKELGIDIRGWLDDEGNRESFNEQADHEQSYKDRQGDLWIPQKERYDKVMRETKPKREYVDDKGIRHKEWDDLNVDPDYAGDRIKSHNDGKLENTKIDKVPTGNPKTLKNILFDENK